MKTKSLFIVALLSMFAFTVSAVTDSVVVSYFGTSTENLVETTPTFTIGDEMVIKAVFSNPSTATAVTVNVLDDSWGSAPNTDSVYAIPTDGNLDIVYVLTEDAPLSFFPDSATNKEIRLRIMVTYPHGDVYYFPRFNTYPVGGVYPEIVEPEPDGVLKTSDVMFATLTILSGDSSYLQGEQTGWTTLNHRPMPGDYIHFQGTYDVSLGDTAFAQSVEIGISYLTSAWGQGPFLHRTNAASVEQGNIDGVIDFKMKVPWFIPDSLLYENAAFTAGDMLPYMGVRVWYSGDPLLKDFNGNKGTNNTYYNWWGAMGTYEGERPTTFCTEPTGITATALSDTNIVITWDDSDEAIWDIAIAEEGSIRNIDKAPIKLQSKTLPTVVGGLEPGKTYSVWVRSVCNPDTLLFQAGDYVEMDGTITMGAASLSSVSADENVHIYPNPTSGKLTITAMEAYNIAISDLSGRAVINSTIMSETNELDMTDMPSGIYIIRFSNARRAFAKTFIMQ